jgi:nucleolar protein 4
LAVEKTNGKQLDGQELIVDLKLDRDEYLKQKNLLLNQIQEKQKLEKMQKKTEDKPAKEDKKIEKQVKKVEKKEEKVTKKPKKEEEIILDSDLEDYSSDDNQGEQELFKQLIGDLEEENSEDLDLESEKEEEEEKIDVEEDEIQPEEVENFEEDEIQPEKEKEEEKKPEKKEKVKKKTEKKEGEKEDLSKTLFIKNLPYDATDEKMKKLFSKYGEIEYVAIVKNKQTKQPSGTAFLKYRTKAAIEKVFAHLEDSQRLMSLEKLKGKKAKHSMNVKDETFMLNGRALSVMRAIDKDGAEKKKEEHVEVKDKRNLHLLTVGYIYPKSEEAKLLPPPHVKKIEFNYQAKKAKLKDPNFSISQTRLCVFNLHKDVTEVELRDLFKEMSGSKKIKQVKIVKDSNEKSRGFGFVEFGNHKHALAALQKINNNVQLKGLLLLVEFAVENAMAVQKLHAIMQRGKVTSQNRPKNAVEAFSKFQKKRKRSEFSDSSNKKRKY